MKSMQEGLRSQVASYAREAVAKFNTENIVPTIVLCGKTGAGKSSLMNALAGGPVQEVGVIPTTQTPFAEVVEEDELKLQVVDLAGFGESGRHKERMNVLFEQIEHAHLLLLVIGYPDRSFQFEQDLLYRLQHQKSNSPPLLIALNKIDLVPPVREWNSETFQLSSPRTSKELAASRWIQHTKDTLLSECIPCAAGEAWSDKSGQYGIRALREAIYLALPEAAKTYFARVAGDEDIREKRAKTIITVATLAAVAAGTQPIPVVPDAALITPIQVGMIVALAQLHGGKPSQIDADRLLGPIVASVGGRLFFQQLLKFLPGFGSVLGASVAGLLTFSLGQTYHYLMAQGIWEPEKEQLLSTFTRFWESNKNLDLLKLGK